MVVKLRVYRYNPDVDDAPHYEVYEVPYVDRMNVLQALNYIHDNLDSSLSYRWNCRAGQCGSCAILINGKPRVTCREVLQDNTTVTLTPLLHVPVIKDLVSDVTPLVERLMKCRPYVERLLPPKRPDRLVSSGGYVCLVTRIIGFLVASKWSGRTHWSNVV